MSSTGRPTKYTPAIVTKLIAAFEMGYNGTEAAAYAGISRKVLYDWLRDKPDFCDKITAAKAQLNIKAKQVLVQSITDGDVQSAKWWLERKAYKEFNTKALEHADATPPAERETIDALNKVVATQEELIALKYRGVVFLMYEQLKKTNARDKEGLARLDRLLKLPNTKLCDYAEMEIYATHYDRANVKQLLEQRYTIKRDVQEMTEQLTRDYAFV